MKLIDKSAVVAEIKRILSAFENSDAPVDRLRASTLIRLLSFLNTLEVKEVQEITASDRCMAEEIIINLKRVEKDYRINLTKEMEWLRNKVNKGK